MFPCIFPIIKDDTEWEKLCWIMDIIIRPGAKKFIKEKPNTSPLSLPSAKESTDKNNKLDIAVYSSNNKKALSKIFCC